LRELTEYLARACFPEIAVPQATADLVDVAATATPAVARPGGPRAEGAARQDAAWRCTTRCSPTTAGLSTPHLWIRAERLGLDVERCDPDRRSDAVRDCVQGDLRGEVKAGVATTPTLFAAGERRTSPLDLAALERLIQQPS
jgi:hypothetical protein